MKLFRCFLIIFFLIIIVIFFSNECEKAYKNGAYYQSNLGHFINFGFDYYPENKEGEKFKYVGIGNENYDKLTIEFTKRKNGFYWWSFIKKIIKKVGL